MTLLESASQSGRGRFTLIAPLENDTAGRGVRYGLIDESSKINLNSISALGLEDEEAHALLMAIPGMTDQAADNVLDFVDSDTDQRTYSDGETQTKNSGLESLDELLLIPGVTADLLYGEDSNRNGLLDPNEDDGELTYPVDNIDGLLNLGWASYLTVYAKESNLQQDGSTRINLNQALLTELYDQLEDEFGQEIAMFVTAFRMVGPVNPSALSSANAVTTGDAQTDSALEQVATGLSQQMFRVAQGTGGTDGTGNDAGAVTRGGLDLSAGATYSIISLYELVDAQVTVTINGMETTLDSPWQSAGSIATTLPILLEQMTTTTAETIDGRINVNQARKEILTGIPNMPEGLPDKIAAAQVIDAKGAPQSDLLAKRATTGWLLIDGLADLPTMQLLDKYICSRGDVMTVQSVGCFDAGGATTRVEAVIDSTLKPPSVIFRRDLTRLGPGYRSEQLIPTTTAK